MGVLNVTPDSFSDGGCFLDPQVAVHHAHALVHQGADLIDVGGESTRPGADPVPPDTELQRVLPVIERLAAALPVPISIDTSKPEVARAALDAGASIVNDIGASLDNPLMAELIARSGAGYVAMHMQGSPKTMQDQPLYADVIEVIRSFFRHTLDRLQSAGVHPDQVVLDVGIGFGKSLQHNLELLAQTSAFTDFQRPMLLGVSRKSFIAKVMDAPPGARLPGGLAATCLTLGHGVHVVRTHDVAETVQAVRVAEAILARRPSP
ncbi:MAG: dihydropteroate synthase [Verrucomicrobiae bacterium]|nr:dihydropteroate synthase [Verrucomicrobiae bacterium]